MPVDASIVVAWLAILAAAGAVVWAVTLVARRQVPATTDEAGDAETLDAHAAAVAAEAVAAEDRAARARERLAAAERARDAAWQAADEAQVAYQAARRAVAEATRPRPPGGAGSGAGGDAAGRGRDDIVAGAALAAYRRGDLTLDQLREVYRRTAGWYPEQERRVREAERCGFVERAARRAYDRAAAAARQAEQEVRVAELAADALVEEAATAAAEAELARVTKPKRRRRGRTG